MVLDECRMRTRRIRVGALALQAVCAGCRVVKRALERRYGVVIRRRFADAMAKVVLLFAKPRSRLVVDLTAALRWCLDRVPGSCLLIRSCCPSWLTVVTRGRGCAGRSVAYAE